MAAVMALPLVVPCHARWKWPVATMYITVTVQSVRETYWSMVMAS